MTQERSAPSESVAGSVELEEADLRAAILEMSVMSRGRVGITLILAFAYGVLAFVGHAKASDLAPQAAFGVFFLFFLFIAPRIRARRLLEAIAVGGDRHASYLFDDESVTFRTAGSTATTAYRSLVDYREGPTAFLVYSSPGVAHVVPKRAFDAEGVARVSALLAANVKKRRERNVNRLILVWFAALLMAFVIWQFFSNVSR
jgi:YcxB-like protein